MSKQWEIERSQLKAEPLLNNKLYNAEKFDELNKILLGAAQKFERFEVVKTYTREIVEEVTNIIGHNKTWITGPLKVRVEFSNEDGPTKVNNKNYNKLGRFKVDIIYNGSEYFDPVANNITTVIGSKGDFAEYSRKIVRENNYTHIKIDLALDLSQQ